MWNYQGREPEEKELYRERAPEIYEITLTLWLNSKLLMH